MDLIERGERELPLSRQADLLGLSRASLYYQPRPPSAQEVRLKHRIDEIYTQCPFYGSRKIAAQLQREGLGINRKTVARYMQEMDIAAIYPGPQSLVDGTTRKESIPIYCVASPARIPTIFGASTSPIYAYTPAGCTRVSILDWYSRYVVSWELDQTLELPFVLTAVQRALAQTTPLICNSDQGSHFTSPQYGHLLKEANVQISMDGKGRALDNVFTERLWRTVKYEEVYIHDYCSPREARQALAHYFEFYNQRRVHQALEYQTPAQVYCRDAGGQQ